MVLAAVCLLPTPTNRRVCASIGRGTHYTTTTLQNILVGRFPAVRSKHHATDRLAMQASYDSVYVVYVWLPCSLCKQIPVMREADAVSTGAEVLGYT